jgi:hypothetical protein
LVEPLGMRLLRLAILVLLCCWEIVAGDSITVVTKKVRHKDYEYKNIRVDTIKQGRIHFRVFSDSAYKQFGSADLLRVKKLNLDDDPTLTQAEELRLKGKWDQSREMYRKALDQATKDWKKIFIRQRLVGLPMPPPEVIAKQAPDYTALDTGKWRLDPAELLQIVDRRVAAAFAYRFLSYI